MGQDLRELLQNNLKDSQAQELQDNHELRFLDKLNTSFPLENEERVVVQKNRNGLFSLNKKQAYKKWFSIAASTIVSIGLGVYLVKQTQNLQQPSKSMVYIEKQTQNIPSIADVSPEFKKFEEMSLATINVGLAQLEVNDTNRTMVRSYMEQLEHLKKEYQLIQDELSYGQVNPQTLEVLIQNLQMQLSLLEQLKKKVKNINEYSPSKAYQNLQT